jgi:signal transduction histidine kinase
LGTPQRNSISIAVAVFVASVLVVAGGLMLLEWAQARKALVSREAELRTILTRTPVMLCTLDAVGVIESVTGAVPDAKWVPGAEAVKVMPDDLVDLVEHAMAGSRSTGDIEVGDRFLDVTCERSATGVIITGFDVTERQAARTELEQLIRTKDEFVASISHELRTPLTAVLGFTEELRRIGAVDEEGRPYLDVVAEQSAEMAAIIEDLLVAVRADLDIFTVVENPLRLEGEARVVLRSLEPRVTKPIRIDDGAAVVIGDSGRVRQIIRNLIINADRYGGDHVEIRISRVDGMGVIEVCDDGAPIEDELRERIFLAYESTGRVQGRTAALGLGLSVSRRLANLMGGSLEYDHRDGWSVFRLALPAAHRPLAALPHAERAHSTPPAAGGGLIEAAG